MSGNRNGATAVDTLSEPPRDVFDSMLCERGDSNSHLFRDRDLNPARLPIPPRSPGPIFAPGRGFGPQDYSADLASW